MKKLITWLSIFLLLLPNIAEATAYTVKAGGGGSFTTIQACSNTAVAGDSCTVFTGSYAGWTQSTSGAAGNRITFTVNPGDTVTITSNVFLNNVAHLVIGSVNGTGCGANATTTTDPFGNFLAGGCFTFNNAGICDGNGSCVLCSITPNCAPTFSDVVISYNTTTGTSPPVFVTATDTNGNASSDNVVSHNRATWTGASTPMCSNFTYLFGDRNRIEYNDVSGTGDDFSDPGGTNLVIRHNKWTLNNMSVSIGCGQSPEHADFVQGIGGITPVISFSLIEDNYIQSCSNDGGNCHALIVRGTNADTVIYRYNYAQNLDGSGASFGGVGDNVPNWKFYNNTIATETTSGGNGNCVSQQNAPNGTAINNICYNTEAGGTFPLGGAAPPNNGNLAFTTGVIVGNWIAPYTTELTYNTLNSQNPLFANYPTDGTIQSGSLAKNGGVALTTANGSGVASTTLIVNDSHFFQPGWTGVAGDCIRVGTTNTTCISAVNYATNTITISPALTWNNGDSVYLYKDSSGTVVLNSANPDIGAFPYISGGAGGPSVFIGGWSNTGGMTTK